METQPIQITITGFEASHSFELPGRTAEAYLRSKGIALGDPHAALVEAALLIVGPVVEEAAALEADEMKADLLNAVRQGV